MKDDTGFARLFGFEKDGILWKCKVDASLLDLVEGGDGALELAFQRARVVDVFGEFGDA